MYVQMMTYMDIKYRKSPKLGKKKKYIYKIWLLKCFLPLGLSEYSTTFYYLTFLPFELYCPYFTVALVRGVGCIVAIFKVLSIWELLDLLAWFGIEELPNFSFQTFLPVLLYKMCSIPLMTQSSLILIFSQSFIILTDECLSATKGLEIYQPTL